MSTFTMRTQSPCEHIRTVFWSTMTTRERRKLMSYSCSGTSSMRMSPDDGSYSRWSSDMHEDLPQPVGPHSATFWPGATVKLSPLRTFLRRSVGYEKCTSRNSTLPRKRDGRRPAEKMARTGYVSCGRPPSRIAPSPRY